MPALVGLVLVLIGVFVGSLFKGVNPTVLLTNVAAILIVVVGSFGAVMSSFDMPTTTGAFKALKKVFSKGSVDGSGTLADVVRISEIARRDSLLKVQDDLEALNEPFLREGLQLAIDGTDPDDVEAVLDAGISSMQARHKAIAGWHEKFGIFSPTFGIIGAVIGLIATMSHLDDPAKIGYGISAAFAATFWGVFLANALFLPWAQRLKQASADEVAYRRMIVAAVRGIQEQSAPRALEAKLLPMLSRADQQAYAAASDKS